MASWRKVGKNKNCWFEREKEVRKLANLEVYLASKFSVWFESIVGKRVRGEVVESLREKQEEFRLLKKWENILCKKMRVLVSQEGLDCNSGFHLLCLVHWLSSYLPKVVFSMIVLLVLLNSLNEKYFD